MDNSQFLSYFWDLSDDKSKEQIVNAAESIVNLVESKQKLEKAKEFNKDKYKLYLNICENPTEDILYTAKRLIGGIASTGVNSRRGFTLAFTFLLEKFSNILNFNEMINIIEKETIVSKGEKGHIKNCALTGKILMLQTVLGVSTINSENILTIFKILFDLIQTKILEEAILQILNNFLLKVNEGFYVELKEKKLTKFFDKFLTLLNKILPNKTNLGSIKTLYEFSLIFCLLSFKDTFPSINNFLHHNTSQIILTENSLSNFFKLLLTQNIREGEFHSSFKLFLNFLTRLNDFTKVIEIWNVLIDPNSQEIFKAVSQKNLQFLIYSVSKYLMEKYFILKYIKQIFDSSYFDNLMKFSSNKKFKFINSLIETLIAGMKSVSESEKDLLADYSKDLLSVFGNDGGLSPQTYKNFFNFLFNNLSDDAKNDFIDLLTKTEETEEADSEFLHFQISALKILMASNESSLPKTTKNKILEFFFKVYYSGEEREDIEVESIIEDRLLSVVFSYIRIPKIEPTEEDAKPIKDKKIIKLLLQVHKFLQTMYESKMLEDLDMDDYKTYLKFFKKISLLTKNLLTEKTQKEEEKPQNDKIYSIVKIALAALILFLKNPNEYTDVITDLIESAKFKSGWQKVYMDLLISLLHKGNNTFSDFIMNCFRKISKYLDMDSVEVLLGFLSQNDKENFEDDVEMNESLGEEENSEENTKENGSANKKQRKNSNAKMFDDMVDDNVEMS